MKVYEMYIKVYCMEDIKKEEVSMQISKLIDCCLMQNVETQCIHTSRTYKSYSFGALMPLEVDGVYKQGHIYTFSLRTLDSKLVDVFKNRLSNQSTQVLKALTLECRLVKQRPIERIYSLTCVIIKNDTGYWRGKYSEEVFEKRIKENMIKKYNTLYHTKLNEDFELFNYIRFDNRKPVAFRCKEITLLGDKVTLGIATNDTAQRLAYMTLGIGLGENNARGSGFMGYKCL